MLSPVLVVLPAASFLVAGIQRSQDERLPLEERHVLRVPMVGEISDMVVLDATRRVLVSGNEGAYEFDLQSERVLSEVEFDLPTRARLPTHIVDVDADGELEFACFQWGWTPPLTVLNRDGSVRWTVPIPARCFEPLDLDHDGNSEFFVGEPNSKEVTLIDHAGKAVWTKTMRDSNCYFRAYDVDGDGLDEILYTDGEALRVCDREGNELFSTVPPDGGFLSGFYIVHNLPEMPSARVAVTCYLKELQERRWYAYEADAQNLLGQCDGDVVRPLSRSVRLVDTQQGIRGLWIYEPSPASHLRVRLCDGDGKGLWEVRLTRKNRKLAACPGASVPIRTDPLEFLVGYGDSLWRFTAP